MDFMQFQDDGRTLTCRSASSPATPGTTWWWLEVTGETQRYAAFRTEPTDTPENLRPRIVATTRTSSPSASVRDVPSALVGPAAEGGRASGPGAPIAPYVPADIAAAN